MLNNIKILIAIIGFIVGCTYSHVYAQKTYLMRLEKLGKTNMKRNFRIGKNLEFGLRAVENNVSPASLHIEKLLNHTVTTPKVLSLPYVQSLPKAERLTAWTQLKTPGFFADSFSVQWKEYSQHSPFLQKDWSHWLENSFEPGTKFEGSFVPSIKNILEIASRPVISGMSAKEAVEQAFLSAKKNQYGFLVVAVEGNSKRPKDVLVMNLKENRWMSLNRSRGQALAKNFGPLIQMFHRENLYLSTVLGKQGVLARIVEDPVARVEVSFNGLVWTKYPIYSPVGRDLLLAAQHQLLITANPETKVFQFAIKEGDPVFSTASAALLWKQAREQKIPFQLADHRIKLFFPETGFDNVFCMNEQHEIIAVAGQPVTLYPEDDLSALEILEFIKYKSALAEQQNRPLLYHQMKGEVLDPEAYLEYLSKDLVFSSNRLEEVQTYESMKGL